jgi:hypothetical protein
MVAGGASAHAARAGQIAGDYTPERGMAGAAEKLAPIGRLEGQHLAGAVEFCFNFGHWRCGFCGQDEFGRIVVDDAALR